MVSLRTDAITSLFFETLNININVEFFNKSLPETSAETIHLTISKYGLKKSTPLL